MNLTSKNSTWGTAADAYVASLTSVSILRIAAPNNGNLLHYSNCSDAGSWTFSPWVTYKMQ